MERRGGGAAFFVRGGDEALTLCTELQRNPPRPTRAADEIQAHLAVLVNGTTPCDCIYISQAAVETHHVRGDMSFPLRALAS